MAPPVDGRKALRVFAVVMSFGLVALQVHDADGNVIGELNAAGATSRSTSRHSPSCASDG